MNNYTPLIRINAISQPNGPVGRPIAIPASMTVRARHFFPILAVAAIICIPWMALSQPSVTHPIKCATSFAQTNLKGKKILQSKLPTVFRDSILSPSGLFLIFYDAVASDTDSITTQAYAERAALEADSAYDFEVNQLGYSPPAFTEGTHHNIYISPLHLDLADKRPYGATFPFDYEALTPSPSGVVRVRSYCVVDNSFNSAVYATHGFDALRITIFHEFFHHIQFSEYGHPPGDPNNPPDYTFFQELSSVWMEWLSTPSVKDYLNYVSSYLRTLDNRFDLSPSEGYGEYIFFAYLTNRFHDTSIVRRIWEYYRDSSADPVTCVDEVLRRDYNSSFCEEYERFGANLIQTGHRFDGTSVIPDAQILPVDAIPVVTLGFDSSWTFVTDALSLQFAEAGFGQDSCIEILCRDTDRALQSNVTVRFSAIGTPPSVVADDPAAYCDTEVCIFPLSVSSSGLEVFPNPFVPEVSSPDYLVVSTAPTPPISVVMNILDLHMNEIRSTKAPAVPFRGIWTAAWDGLDDMGKPVPSGEYLYTLHVDGALKVGKIVVVRK